MLLSQIRHYKPILVVVILYCLYAFGMTLYFGHTEPTTDAPQSLADNAFKLARIMGFVTMFIVITLILRIMIIDRPKRLIKRIYHDLRTIWLTPQFIVRGLTMIICLYVFVFAFTAMKQIIPILHPYGQFDTLFYHIDKAVHFGVSPWQITHSIFGAPVTTFAINFLYNLWFFILYAVFTLQAFIHENEQTRKTYFLSFFLCWIINGTVFATLLSSVGPCYYNLFYDLQDGPYTELLSRLNVINETYPIWALKTQDMLWAGYADQSTTFGGGISAMPSLHVSIAFLHVLLGYTISKLWGRLLLAFFLVIMIGSVHLGWHYAIDGYFSIITTTCIWFACKWIIRKSEKRLNSTLP